MPDLISQVLIKNGLIFAFLFVGAIMLFSFWFSKSRYPG